MLLVHLLYRSLLQNAIKYWLIFIGSTLLLNAAWVMADPKSSIRPLAEKIAERFQHDEFILNAVITQNRDDNRRDPVSLQALNEQWLLELSKPDRNLINRMQNKEISRYLQKIKQSASGEFLELIVMDDKGLNVGQSSITSDYWQGDEDKWIKPFLVAPGVVFIDELRWDESVQNFQVQISFTLFDLLTRNKIGAMTVGLSIGRDSPYYLPLRNVR